MWPARLALLQVEIKIWQALAMTLCLGHSIAVAEVDSLRLVVPSAYVCLPVYPLDEHRQ